MKRIIAILMLIVICLSMTSCEGEFLSVESLMRPPKLSGNDSLIQAAFESSVSEFDHIVMKTPFNGKYRSSYILFDIDQDDQEEAIVLYSVPAEDNYVFAEIFKFSQGEWVNISIINSYCHEIYEINFADINGDGCNEIFFSWVENTNMYDDLNVNFNLTCNLMIYSYDGKKVELVKNESYTNLFIKDINNNNSDEVLIFKNTFSGNSNSTTARIISFNEDYSVCYDKKTTITSLLEINNIVSDRVVESGKAVSRIFVDGAVDERDIITEIIEINEKDFNVSLPLYNDNNSLKPRTLRNNNSFCMDIDKNGVIDIPTVEIFPYSMKINKEKREPIDLIYWSEYSDNEFNIKFKTLLNSKVGHVVFIPDSFIGKITAIYDEENMNLTFYSVGSNGTYKTALFSFRIFTKPDWEDNNYNYEMLYQNDTYVYSYLIFKDENYDRYKKFITENFFTL